MGSNSKLIGIRYAFQLLIGIAIGIAAIAKLYLVLSDPFADLTAGFPWIVLWLAICFELCVCYISIFCTNRTVVWAIQVFSILGFTAVSAIKLIAGSQNCGCFGPIVFPTWLMLLIDIAVLGTTIAIRPRVGLAEHLKSWRSQFASRLRVVGNTLGFIVAFGILSVFFQAQIFTWTSPISSDKIEVSALVVGRPHEFVAIVQNNSEVDAKIVGKRASCICITDLDEVPFFPPGKSEFKGVIKPNFEGPMKQKIICYVDHPDQTFVLIEIVGIVDRE